jgi:CDP-4-dehydro-6-deoxyglucose reductase
VAYACGSERMIHDAQRALADAGLPPRRFHFDAFVGSD